MFWLQLFSVCFAMKLFFSFKIHCLQMLLLFQTRDGLFFFHCHTCHAFFAVSSKNILFTARLSLFCSETLFLLQNTLSTNVSVVSYQGWAIYFHCHTCLHLSRFICCIIWKYLSHIVFWSQFISVCFAMELFFSFKLQCLQMLLLFQTRDGPIFFIVTLVYTCRAFFAVSSKNIYPIHCFVYSSSQSVLQWISFSPSKYIVYKCFSCFIPGTGHLFSLSHLSTLVALYLLYHLKIFIPYSVLVTVRLKSVLQWNYFSPSNYIVYKCYCCFRPGMGQFFSSSHLSTLVALFLQYHHKIFIQYIVLVKARLSLFCNGTLFLLQITLSTNVTVVSDQGWANFFHHHTCLHLSHFFCSIIKNIYPIYCFGHSLSQSVSQWNSLLLQNTLSTNVSVVSY